MLNSQRSMITFSLCLFACLANDPISNGQESNGQELDPLKAYREVSAKWEKDIAAFEEKDKSEIADKSSILCLGSSSIRRWHATMAQDLAPWPVVGRGYGGAKFSDLAIYAPRLLAAHHPRGVLIYVGNDIVDNPEQDKTPEELVRLFGIVVAAVKKQVPNAEIFAVAISPSPKRFGAWSQIQRANQQIKAFCEKDAKLHFIETYPAYLTADGQPRSELFVEDQVHQSDDGYKIWSGIIRTEFERVFGSPNSTSSPN